MSPPKLRSAAQRDCPPCRPRILARSGADFMARPCLDYCPPTPHHTLARHHITTTTTLNALPLLCPASPASPFPPLLSLSSSAPAIPSRLQAAPASHLHLSPWAKPFPSPSSKRYVIPVTHATTRPRLPALPGRLVLVRFCPTMPVLATTSRDLCNFVPALAPLSPSHRHAYRSSVS